MGCICVMGGPQSPVAEYCRSTTSGFPSDHQIPRQTTGGLFPTHRMLKLVQLLPQTLNALSLHYPFSNV